MQVVVTRPADDAQGWCELLRQAGHEPVALPLIDIAPVDDPSPLRACWERLSGFAAVMFVSANAVRGFRAAGAGLGWPHGTRAWATGPGTAAALAEAGVPASCIDAPPPDAAQFDSESLWPRVQEQARPGCRVLLVRGEDAVGRPAGRDWLAARLAERGAQVQVQAAYRRLAPRWTPAQREQALDAARAGAVWLFSSSEAVGHLRGQMPGADWSGARAIATHERIGQAAREAGFGVVCLSRPAGDAVLAALESIR